MKTRLRLLSIFALAAMAGCSATAIPFLYNGQYYMAGDDTCRQVNAVTATRVMCVDKVGNQTGYRDAMTMQEIYMYQMQVAQQRARSAELDQMIASNNATLAANNAALQRSNMSMSTPTVGPIYQSGSNQVSCIGAGIYTNCRY